MRLSQLPICFSDLILLACQWDYLFGGVLLLCDEDRLGDDELAIVTLHLRQLVRAFLLLGGGLYQLPLRVKLLQDLLASVDEGLAALLVEVCQVDGAFSTGFVRGADIRSACSADLVARARLEVAGLLVLIRVKLALRVQMVASPRFQRQVG